MAVRIEKEKKPPIAVDDPMPEWAVVKCLRMVEINLWKGDINAAKGAIDKIFLEVREKPPTIEFGSPLSEIFTSQRILNELEKWGVRSVGSLSRCSLRELTGIRNFGPVILNQICTTMRDCGFPLREEK